MTVRGSGRRKIRNGVNTRSAVAAATAMLKSTQSAETRPEQRRRRTDAVIIAAPQPTEPPMPAENKAVNSVSGNCILRICLEILNDAYGGFCRIAGHRLGSETEGVFNNGGRISH